MNFISRLDVNFLDSTQNTDKVSGALIEGQGHRVKVPASRSQWSVKSRSRALGQGACLKTVSRIITMQGFILTANTAAKKLTLFLDST